MKRTGTQKRRGTVKDSLTVREQPSPPRSSGRVARLSRGTLPTQFATIHRLAASIRGLQQDAVRIYAPVVDALVRENSCDVRTIEQTLDGLLSFCAYEPALQLYKKLCRHYYTINPAATAEYVYAYREMWDEEPAEVVSCKNNSQSSPVTMPCKKTNRKAKHLKAKKYSGKKQ